MTLNPYSKLPDKAFWRRAIASVPPGEVEPIGTFGLKIDRDTRVATAGSCFAQHIARHLNASGYNHFIAEPGHPILPESVRAEQGYGLFSCRYGNIYTARQLLQLFERAYGRFVPSEHVWLSGNAVVDPFRPRVQRGGFVSEAEMRRDREQHLAAVRQMFETLHVLVFTLGLTESWRSRDSGAVFPLCPGVDGGEFDPDRHEFYNQPVEDVVADLAEFWTALCSLNPGAQLVLTVSPVPLVATAQPGEHVLSATTYSKSVLRVAAEV
ncbi:MAG: GSCFA domain-containing protein, partial [Sphingomicrobium sp.]